MGNEIQLGIRLTADGGAAIWPIKATREEIDRLSASGSKLASQYTGLDKAIATTSTSTFKSSEEFRKLDGRLASLLSTIDPVYRSTRQLDAGNELLHQGLKNGLLTQTQYQASLGNLAEKFGIAAEGAGKSALGTAQARRELIVLGHEAVSGNFARMPGSFLVLAERMGATSIGAVGMGLAIAGGAAALVYAAVKADEYERTLQAINRQFTASGSLAFVASGGVKNLVDELDKLPGINKKIAEEMITSFAHTPEIGAQLRQDLLRLAPDIAAAYGETIPKATQRLADGFKTAGEGVKKFGEYLTAEQIVHIEGLEESNKKIEAQQYLLQILQDKFRGLNDQAVTPLEKATSALGNSWQHMMDNFGKGDGLLRIQDGMVHLINSASWLIDHAQSIGKAIAIMNPGLWPALLMSGSSTPAAAGQSQSGKIGVAGQDATNVAAMNMKDALAVADQFKSKAREIASLTAEMNKLKDAQKQVNTTTQDGAALYARLGDGIAGITKKIADLKKSHVAKDDPTRNLLEDQLKVLEGGVQQEKTLLADRDKMLALYNSENLISLKDYYAGKKAAQEENLSDTMALYDRELAALLDAQSKTKRLTDKASLQVKIDDVKNRQSRLQIEAGQQALVDTTQNTRAEEAYARSIEEVNARVQAMTGNLKDAAAVNFDRQNEALVKRFTAEGNQKALDQLTILKQYAIAQGEVNDLQLKAKDIQEQLGIEEARINLNLQTGAISQFEAMREISAARQKAVDDLKVEADALDKVAQSGNFPKITQEADQFRLKLDELNATTDLLGKKLTTVFEDSGASALENFLNKGKLGFKDLADAFNAFADDVVRQINRIVAQNLSQAMFGGSASGGGGGSIGGLLGMVFGGGGSGGGGGSFTDNGVPVGGLTAASSLPPLTGGGGDLSSWLANLPSFDVGIDRVPFDMYAKIHKDERIVTAAKNNAGAMGMTVINHFAITGAVDNRSQKRIGVETYGSIRRAARSYL